MQVHRDVDRDAEPLTGTVATIGAYDGVHRGHREVVRQVQALARLHNWGTVDEGPSAYIQARQRLPQECLERVLAATAQAAPATFDVRLVV